jgi:hypothetical protein
MSRTFDILLESVGDEGAEYHVKNQRGEVQRHYVIDRGTTMLVQCSLAEVVHGEISPDSSVPGTLAVFDFRFLPRASGRRFAQAEISVIFADAEGRELFYPEVLDISPLGHFSMHPTTKKQEVKRRVRGGVYGGGYGASAGVGFSYQLNNSIDKTYATQTIGAIRFGKKGSMPNTAEWTLLENASQQSGIPTFFRTAVLLGRCRGNAGLFVATVEVKAKAKSNLVSSIGDTFQSILGRIPRDDPVVFSPSEPPTTDQFDPKNLSAYLLKDVSVALSTSILPNAIQCEFLRNPSMV